MLFAQARHFIQTQLLVLLCHGLWIHDVCKLLVCEMLQPPGPTGRVSGGDCPVHEEDRRLGRRAPALRTWAGRPDAPEACMSVRVPGLAESLPDLLHRNVHAGPPAPPEVGPDDPSKQPLRPAEGHGQAVSSHQPVTMYPTDGLGPGVQGPTQDPANGPERRPASAPEQRRA